jgi:dTDP-4-amino-4,6-dideoxygalactose transaminase
MRSALFEYCAENNIRLQVHYPPVHLHPYYRKCFKYKKGDFPEAEKFYKEEISLPIYP